MNPTEDIDLQRNTFSIYVQVLLFYLILFFFPLSWEIMIVLL